MPRAKSFSGLYDIQVNVQTQGELQRLASINHPIQVELSRDKKEALVSLSESVDRSYVPSQDFVLYIRDTQMDQPSAISSLTATGRQAISLSIQPDLRSRQKKQKVFDQIAKKSKRFDEHQLDMCPHIKYAMTDEEKAQLEDQSSSDDE